MPQPDALTQKADSFVQQNLRWNFSVNVLDNMFFALAISLISQETIMPLLVSQLTDSKIAIGLIPAIFSVSFYLPQLFVASHAERLKRKLPFVLIGSGLVQRLPYLLIGLSILLFAEDSPALALILFFAFIGAAAFGGGVVTPAWFTMVGKVVPVHRRGIFFGLADGGGMLMGVMGAFLVGIILDQLAYPTNFALLFLIAAVLMAISWVWLALTREPESRAVKQPIPLRHYFSQLPAIFRHRHNYRRFVIAYSVNRLSMMAVGFFIIFGSENFNPSGRDIGTLTAIFIGTQAVMHLIFGWVGDQLGHKFNLTLSAFAIALAALFALSATHLWSLIPAFACLAIAIASDGVSKFNIVLEFAAPQDQPTFIGLTNTILAPVTFLAPILGGWMVTSFGFQMLFGASLVCGLIGGLLLWGWVREPRKTQAQTTAPSPP